MERVINLDLDDIGKKNLDSRFKQISRRQTAALRFVAFLYDSIGQIISRAIVSYKFNYFIDASDDRLSREKNRKGLISRKPRLSDMIRRSGKSFLALASNESKRWPNRG
jgi:hypothetical protein